MGDKLRRMSQLQWQVNVATGVFSAIAISLAFGRFNLLAQLMMVPVTACFIASCVIAYRRYKLNRQRRAEILSQLDAERDARLIELFDGARQQRRLPPDLESKDGYTAAVREAKAREAARQAQTNLPPGIRKRGNGNSGDGNGRR